jgi:hypothetical protein
MLYCLVTTGGVVHMWVTACRVIQGTGAAVRVVALLSAAAASAVVLTATAVAVSRSGGVAAAASGTRVASSGTEAAPDAMAVPGVTVTLALGPLTRQACPATAAACVDLADHLTWLQSGGQISYGPVRMEPGPPGSPHATPRGTFYVSWKGGPDLISNEYDEPMPWAVFFAPGGIAFHGGSLTVPSHGCVHLTIANARYYNEHLPIGAEVVVF